jgi:hypothetical protein
MIHESTLQARLLALAPSLLPNVRLFRRNVLKVRIEGRAMRAGIKGQCDLYGYERGGRIIELELKSLTGRQTPEQVRWAEFCRVWGVPHLVLKPAQGEGLDETVGRWCEEIGRALKESRT